MRKRLLVTLFCVAAAGIAAIRAASADTSPSTGSIPENHKAFLGTWNCVVTLAAMEGSPAQTATSTLTISMAPGMTIRSHVDSKEYNSDSYEGYIPKTKTWWMTTADVLGNSVYETSTDHKVYTGTSWGAEGSTPTRDTRTIISATKIRDLTELKLHDAWTKIADATCTK